MEKPEFYVNIGVIKIFKTFYLYTKEFFLYIVVILSTLIARGYPQSFTQDIESLKYYIVVEKKDSFYIVLKDILREGRLTLSTLLGTPELLPASTDEFFWELIYEQWYSPYLLWNYYCVNDMLVREHLKNIENNIKERHKILLSKMMLFYISCKYDSAETIIHYYIEKINHQDLRVYHLLALIYIKKKKFREAKLLLESLITKDKKYYFTYAFYYTAIGVYPKGLEMLDEYYQEYPNDIFMYYYKALLFSKSKLQNQALQWIEKALDRNPDNPLFWLKKIEIEYLNKNYKSVIQLSSWLISKGYYKKELYFYQGNAYASLNDMANACKSWEKSAKLGHDFAETYFNYFCKKK